MLSGHTVFPLASFRSLLRPALAAALLLLLAACATAPQRDDGAAEDRAAVLEEERRGLADLLDRAESLPEAEAAPYYLEAARLLVEMERHQEAAALLDDVEPEDLEPVLGAELVILRAALRIHGGRPEDALDLLIAELPVTLARLPQDLQKQVRLLRAEAYLASGQPLASAQERINAGNLLAPDEISQNHELIWNALTELPLEQLETLARNAQTFVFQGWYELAAIGKAQAYNLDRQTVELERWQETWARHPAAANLPQAMELARTLASERPSRIALLLPLETQAGQVIRDGFMTAYYDIQSIGGQVPEIRLYDTSRATGIMELVERAAAEGAQLVIGPLQKDLVSQLLQESRLPVPVLALNNVEGARARSPRLYQFALSPENEARQIALRAWRDGHRYAAILSPAQPPDDSFTRKRASFIAQWEELGGEIVEQEVFREDYTEVIERLLNLDDSEYRRDQLSQLLGRPLQFTQRRRQDIDFIFLIARPGPARQIKPSLAYLYAGDIPVYATQDVYSGLPRPLEDADLNGVLFSDSPWLLDSGDQLQARAQALFPQTGALFLRLQAFGVDAFRLYPRLKQLEAADESRILGATGLLKMDENRNINQDLEWARFNEGRVKALDDPT